MTPVDVVPSIFHFLFLPMCEGIAVGLLVGSGLLWAMSRLESFFAPADHPLPDRRAARQTVVGARRPAAPAA